MIQAVSPNTYGAVAHITPTLRDTLCANSSWGAVLMPPFYYAFKTVRYHLTYRGDNSTFKYTSNEKFFRHI